MDININSMTYEKLSPAPARRRSSPLKQRTPSRRGSTASSPRKSPTKKVPRFDCESESKSVSFTPKRAQQPPRAWERRPATPYVPRDEKQKIWKRVPLGELGVDSNKNKHSGLSERAQERTKDCVRVVKKLKVGHFGGGNDDKENLVLAVESKTAQDENYCEHVKKVRVVDLDQAEEMEEAAGDDKNREGNVVESDSESSMTSQGRGAEFKEEPALERNDIERGSDQEEAELVHAIEEYVTEPNDTVQATIEVSIAPSDIANPETDGLHSIAQANVSDDVQEVPEDILVGKNDEDVETTDDDAAHDQRSSSPPTILAENITVDELAAKQCAEDPSHNETTTFAIRDEATEQNIPRRISDGEAAYLRAFMDRTMTEKTAKERIVASSIDTHSIQLEPEPVEAPTDASESSGQQAEIAQESTSPLRRSKRALVTSIPRLQSLPNPIQLKRANGNEFIFTANKGNGSVNLGVTTRTNTKKNKGSAINVPSRLEQLMAQKANETPENEHPDGVDGLKASKKRKQEKNKDGSKTKKALRWNDENLVSIRELESEADELADPIEDSSQEGAQAQVQAQGGDGSPGKAVKLTLTVKSSTKSDSDDANVKRQQSNSNARRARRAIVGSVNGTPAPKSSRNSSSKLGGSTDGKPDEIVEASETHLDASEHGRAKTNTGAAVASKVESGARPSRMPVPKTTLIKRGVAAGTSSVGSKLPAAAGGVSTRTEQVNRRGLRPRS